MTQLHPALESIQFQKTDLFVGITNCISNIRKLNPNISEKLYYESKEFKELSDVIKKLTGLMFEFEDTDGGPGVYLPRLTQKIFDTDVVLVIKQNQQNGFDINYDIKRLMSALDKDVIHGEVDLRKSKVTGAFAEIKCKMFMPRSYLYYKPLLDEELAAIVLHEIGHVFTSFEYLSRSSKTNQALAVMLRVMDKSTVFEDRKVVFSKAKQKLDLDAKTYESIEKETDPDKVTTVIIADAVRRCRSELGDSIYDLTSCEYLSDQFATRHGAGKYMITGLDKMGKYNDDVGAMDYFTLTWTQMLTLSCVLVSPLAWVASGAVVAGALAVAFPTVSLLWTVIGLSGVNARREVTDEYDNDYTRFSRIKHQMVQRLKDPDASADEKKLILNYIEDVDPIIKKNIGDTDIKLRNRIAGFFNANIKRDFEYTRLQKDLELIGNNDLYVMSEKLKLI